MSTRANHVLLLSVFLLVGGLFVLPAWLFLSVVSGVKTDPGVERVSDDPPFRNPHTPRAPTEVQDPRTTTAPPLPPVQNKAADFRYHAIVIGINDYQQKGENGWGDLITARNDANAVAEVLETEYGFGVTRLLDADASRDKIIAALDELSTLTWNDAVLIYFAGHGEYSEDLGHGYWIPSDARRNTTADFIRNTTINAVLETSPARHILVIADACYGGALFRKENLTFAAPDFQLFRDRETPPQPPQSRQVGGRTNNELQLYERSFIQSSRYLVTSGDLEPVLDTGGKHTVFARHLLNRLRQTEPPLFSASDLGLSIRQSVSARTSQLVRMGELRSPAHSGGELIFVRNEVDFPFDPHVRPERRPVESELAAYSQAEMLYRNGADQSARQMLAHTSPETHSDLHHLLQQRFSPANRAAQAERARHLFEQLEEAARQVEDRPEDRSRPRVVAKLGVSPDDPQALLLDTCLQAALLDQAEFSSVDRASLGDVFQELALSASDLSDSVTKLERDKLRPAGFLLKGELLQDQFSVRLIDSETTEILGIFFADLTNNPDPLKACRPLAAKIAKRIEDRFPLFANTLTFVGERQLKAPLGRVHGLQKTSTLQLEKEGETIGTATVSELGDLTSIFTPKWNGPAPKSLDGIRLR